MRKTQKSYIRIYIFLFFREYFSKKYNIGIIIVYKTLHGKTLHCKTLHCKTFHFPVMTCTISWLSKIYNGLVKYGKKSSP